MNINAGIVFMQTYVKNLKCLLVLAETILRIAVCFLIPPMLPRFGMDGGNVTSHALFAERTDLKGLTQIYGQIGSRHTAPTAERRWMEATTVRLIDANALLKIYENWIPQLVGSEDAGDKRGVETCIAVLQDAPTVDAVEVVRCKDCIRRYDTDECPMCFLSKGQYYEFTRNDGFCDRGEEV